MITKDIIKDTVYELYKEAVVVLGDDVKKALEDALKTEEHDLAQLNIKAILKNIELAKANSNVPGYWFACGFC